MRFFGRRPEPGEDSPTSSLAVPDAMGADETRSLDGLRPPDELQRVLARVHLPRTMEEEVRFLIEDGATSLGAVFGLPLLIDRGRMVLSTRVAGRCGSGLLQDASKLFGTDLGEFEFPLDEASRRMALLDGREVRSADRVAAFWGDVVPPPVCDAAQEAMDVHQVFALPLFTDEDLYGLYYIFMGKEQIPTEAVELYGVHVTLAVRNLVSVEEARALGEVDQVTWTANRTRFLELLDAETQRGLRYETPFAVVLAVFEDLKQFVDTYGQAMANRLLRSAAMAVGRAVRAPDVVARYDQDTLALLLPMADHKSAQEVANRAANVLGNIRVTIRAVTAQPVTAVTAVAAFPEDGRSRAQLLERAEAALAERRGKAVRAPASGDEQGRRVA